MNPKPRVYRLKRIVFFAVFTAAIACVFLAPTVVSGEAQVASLVFACVFALLTVRLSMLGAHVGIKGVKIVGPLASRTVAWEEIDRFVDLPFQRYPHAVHVVLRSGQEALIPGLDIGRFEGERGRLKIQEMVDKLNQELADWHRGRQLAVVE